MIDQNTGKEKLVDPERIVFVLDYDEICYSLLGSQFGLFKNSFALAATNLIPDFDVPNLESVLKTPDYEDYKQVRDTILASNISDCEKSTQIDLRNAFFTAVAGWDNHKDCTHYFTQHLPEGYKKFKLADDLDRMAHGILPTYLWEPIKNLDKQIKKLQEYGDVVIWTHGRHEMVLRTLSQNGLLGLIAKDKIFDKQTILSDGIPLGRKDSGHNNWGRFCKELGVLPENVGFIDDTYPNHESAASAGIGARVHVNVRKEQGLGGKSHYRVANTNVGMRKLIQFGKNKKAYFQRHVQPTPVNKPEQPSLPQRKISLR